MNSNPKLSYAIAAILSGAPVGLSYATEATATDADTSNSEGIQEIVVTAQRRSESIENVPITIQAITGEQLKQLNVQTFDDLLKYTPNVTYSGNGPGMGNIFMRGLSSGGSGNQSQSTTAPFPNVALYLDDQSMTFPARNVDVYMVDMERVEVLEGPQGTLFGGGAQAGAIRYITNKPKLDITEGDVNVGYGITARGGDPNANGNATINIPLINDVLAVRGTVFTDHRGGYISNVPGTISVAGGPIANNNNLVGIEREPGDLHRPAGVGAAEDQRRLERPHPAELPEHAGGRLFPGLSARGGWDAARSRPDHGLRPGVRQGSLREHGVDAQRPDSRSVRRVRRLEGRLHGQLPGPPHRAATGLFQLPHQRRRPVLRLRRRGRPGVHKSGGEPDGLLSAGGQLERHRREHASEPRAAIQHLGRQPVPHVARRLLGRLHHQRSDELQLSGHTAVRPGEPRHGAGRRPGLYVCGRPSSRHLCDRSQPARPAPTRPSART